MGSLYDFWGRGCRRWSRSGYIRADRYFWNLRSTYPLVVKFGYNQGKNVHRENYSTKQVLFWHNFMEIIEKILSVIGKILLVIWKFYKWLFVTGWGLTLLILALMDLWLGDGSWWRSLNRTQDPPTPDPPTPKEISGSTTDKVVKKYGKDLEKYVESKSTISIEAQIIEKIRNSPGKLIEEILSQEEMEILFEMILRTLGLI